MFRINLNSRKVPNIQTVSYTHLRAHETVLDLVCRLLLEKKKKTNPNAFISSNTTNTINSHYIHIQQYNDVTTK